MFTLGRGMWPSDRMPAWGVCGGPRGRMPACAGGVGAAQCPGSTPAPQTPEERHQAIELNTDLSRSLPWAPVTLAQHGLLAD